MNPFVPMSIGFFLLALFYFEQYRKSQKELRETRDQYKVKERELRRCEDELNVARPFKRAWLSFTSRAVSPGGAIATEISPDGYLSPQFPSTQKRA